MTGICGGVGDAPKVGDLIVAEKSWDWQSGKWIADGSFEAAPDQVAGDRDLINAVLSCESELERLHRSFPDARPGSVPTFHCGPMVSGSAVVADLEKHALFKKQHRKAIAVDMECYGVYSAVSTAAAPVPKVLCIKAVSDLANRDKSDDYQAYCSYMSAGIALKAIARYFSVL
jgi:nucleoside phosphorylase